MAALAPMEMIPCAGAEVDMGNDVFLDQDSEFGPVFRIALPEHLIFTLLPFF